MPHTEHSTVLTCRKCLTFYKTYVQLSPGQLEKLSRETQTQSESQLWQDARKLHLTASTAKRVPKRSTTNPQRFLSEHLHPSLLAILPLNMGKLTKTIQLMEDKGHTVDPDHHPWFGASPDGLLDSSQLLEIQCPLKGSASVAEFLSQPTGDIRCLEDGQYVILPNGPRGYYLQVQLTMMCLGLQTCNLVIWTPSEHLELDIPSDEAFTDTHIKHLENFYFSQMLPTLVD